MVDRIKKIIHFLNSNDGSLKNKTIRSGFWVAISSFGMNILNLSRSVILARLLIPEIFGLMGICMIIIRGMEVFTQTGFGAALVHRQKGFEEARDTAFTLMVLRGILLAVITFIMAPIIANYYDNEILDSAIKVIAISFIFKGLHNINRFALQKDLNFKRLTYCEQATSLINFLTVVLLAYYLRSVWALIIGQVVASFIGAILSFMIIPGRPGLRFDKKIAKELFSYGKYITGLSIILFIASEIDKAFVGKILGMEYLGYYVMAFTIANLPATHISKMASKVIFPAYSKLQNNQQKLKEVYMKALKLIAGISVPLAVGIMALAPEIIRVVYGEKWLPAVGALQVLCLYGGFRAFVSINGYLFNGIGKPNIPFYLNLLRLFLIIVAIYPLTHKYGLVGLSIAVTIPLVVQFFLGISVLIRTICLTPLKIVKVLTAPLIYSTIMAFIILYAKYNIVAVNVQTLSLLIFIGISSYMMLNFKYFMIYFKKKSLHANT